MVRHLRVVHNQIQRHFLSNIRKNKYTKSPKHITLSRPPPKNSLYARNKIYDAPKKIMAKSCAAWCRVIKQPAINVMPRAREFVIKPHFTATYDNRRTNPLSGLFPQNLATRHFSSVIRGLWTCSCSRGEPVIKLSCHRGDVYIVWMCAWLPGKQSVHGGVRVKFARGVLFL